jgi:hypothetical protein
MYKKIVGIVILVNIVLTTIIPTTILSSPSDDPWWDKDYDFRKLINTSVNTSLERAIYQPIDVNIKFDNPCWVKDENLHSIRVVFQDENGFKHLESQIYNLNFKESEIIDSCNLVFLIPEESNGNEKYYVYYDDDSKPSPEYDDHVGVGEDSYNYGKIPGINFKSLYFKIIQDGYIVYAVNKEASGLDLVVSQQVEKIKDKTEDIDKPDKAEFSLSLACAYYYKKQGKMQAISSWDVLKNKKIIVDGNLMVKVGIVSESGDGHLKTTTIYKYYYCPTDDKKIFMSVKHEVNKPNLPKGPDSDFTYCLFICKKIKSQSIEELNFGSVPPYLYYYSEDDTIKQVDIDQFPERGGYQQNIGLKDDVDLGITPWFSVGEGETGRADAVILDSNEVVKSGTDERDGVSLQIFENNIDYPGIDINAAQIYLGKNVYEGEEEPDHMIPEDYVVEFNAVFFTTKNGGIKAVQQEAKIFKDLIKNQPSKDENESDGQEEIETYDLTVYTRFSPSFPFGSFLSPLYGCNVSYLTAELYKENEQKDSGIGSVSRLSLNKDFIDNASDMTPLEILKNFFIIFDWENKSFYKKYRFTDVEPGRYLIKIFRENPIFKNEREFIGYKIVNVENDMSTQIDCKREGKLKISFFDQNNNGIENVKTFLKKGNIIISSGESNANGKAILKAPCGLSEEYTLNSTYKGFLINEEEIKLGLITKYIPIEKSESFDVYDFKINVKDSKGDAPSFDFDFKLTSKDMAVPVTLSPDVESNGTYEFKKLYPADYDLIIKYNSFKINETIEIKKDESLSIELYDFKTNIVDSWNLSPDVILDVSLKSLDFEINAVNIGNKISNKTYLFSNLYPGDYRLRINYKIFGLEEDFTIPHQETTVMFPAEFNLTTIVYDSHGNLLENAKIKVSREGKEKEGITNESGVLVLLIPPGTYHLEIFFDDELIAQRNIELITGNDLSIVTTNEPVLSYVVIILSVILIVGFLLICFLRKRLKLFLKILAISLAFIAIVTPWWAMEGSTSNPEMETSTKLYVVPPAMVDITKNSNVTAGGLTPLKEELKQDVNLIFATVEVTFISIIDLLPKLIIIGVLFLISSIILNIYLKKKLSVLFFFLSILILLGSIIVFTYAMSILTTTSFGGFFGSGNIDVLIPGENMYVTMKSSWGPGIGYYLLILTNVILIFIFIFKIKNQFIDIIKRILPKK